VIQGATGFSAGGDLQPFALQWFADRAGQNWPARKRGRSQADEKNIG
jgi:hypothetical protein